MDSAGLRFVSMWGLWILGAVMLLAVALIWCHEVNKKLNEIMVRLDELGKSGNGSYLAGSHPAGHNPGASSSRTVSPFIAVFIIGAAIFVLFIVPLWLVNR
ncbi:MAG: hypothetical protein Q8Q08_03910 [Candidatus Omnitrophota bacterium]|nr:hypothetical protein [Candidatus Omnitrophota bacterium]MDZ4242676.1 hypothetical protein [Candidatus Omnitrophota bacterium]